MKTFFPACRERCSFKGKIIKVSSSVNSFLSFLWEMVRKNRKDRRITYMQDRSNKTLFIKETRYQSMEVSM